MKLDAKKIVKTTFKVAGAACVATGIVVAGAVIASGAALGSMTEGFATAKRAVKDIFDEKESIEIVEPAGENA